MNFFAATSMYISLVSVLIAAEKAEAQSIVDTSDRQAEVSMMVRVDSAPSEGLTDEDLNPDFLRQAEQQISSEMISAVEQSLGAQGFELHGVEADTSGFFTYAGQRKLVVLRVNMTIQPQGGGFQQTVVSGIIGDERFIITCGWPNSADIPITYGPCAEQIESTFGASVISNMQ